MPVAFQYSPIIIKPIANGIQTKGGPITGKKESIAVTNPHKNAPFIPNKKKVIVKSPP